ncbi:MAG: thioredoxin-disulfide reductase [Lachnospiraceae bacterium]
MTDIIIIGAGTAGLTAGIYACRAGKTVKVLESVAYGGQIINTPDIENYPGIAHISGFDFAQQLYDQATALGVEVLFESATSIETEGNIKKVTVGSGNTYECKAVILATGAKNRHLGLDREDELVGKGISYCATCDGMFFRGKDVAVNGGGNTALGDALYLSGICHKVYVIHRRDQFRGSEADAEKLTKLNNVEFVMSSTVTALNGDVKLESIDVTNKLSGEVRKIPVSALFIAIGQTPDNKAFENLVRLDEKGYIVAGEDCRTSCDGIFAAGDCRTKSLRQLTTAAADGSIAATAACEYIDRM